MPWNGTILGLRGTFPDRDHVTDLTSPWPRIGVMAAATQGAAAAKVRSKLFFQHSARLDEQALVDRLVRHSHTLIVAELPCKPAGDLLRRPLQLQLLCNQCSQAWMSGQMALLWPHRSIPGALISDLSSVAPPLRAVARNLAADRRRRSAKATRYLAH